MTYDFHDIEAGKDLLYGVLTDQGNKYKGWMLPPDVTRLFAIFPGAGPF
jgi:hypothetical protein